MRAGTPSTGRLKKVSLGSAPLPPAVGRILDPLLVYDNLNLGRRIDPVWPEPEWRAKVTLIIKPPHPPTFTVHPVDHKN